MTKACKEVPVKDLRRVCDPSIFQFTSTSELPVLTDMIGQERAVRATSFGIAIESPGYHIFALCPAGTGKAIMIKDLLERKSAHQPVPDDWCYVNNFEDSDCPRALRLPAGKGSNFQADMDWFVEELGHEIPHAFASKDYEEEREKLEAKFQEKRQALFKEIEKVTAAKDFALLQTPRGFVLATVIAGERNDEGEYPENTINLAVQARLRDLAEKVQSFSRDSNHRDPVREKEIIL